MILSATTISEGLKNFKVAMITGFCLAAVIAAITIMMHLPEFNDHFHLFGLTLHSGDFYTQNSLAMKAAIVGLCLVLLSLFEKKLPKAVNIISAYLLIALTAITFFFALQLPGAKRTYYFDTSDTFHYFLMPKYAEAISYFDVYTCSLIAVEENGHELPEWFRRLDDTATLHINEALTQENKQYCHQLFTPERWLEFRRDHASYATWAQTRGFYNRFHDHGYNGTPVFTFITHLIANAVDLNEFNLTVLALTNLLAVTAMFCLVVTAFGWRLAAYFCLLWAVSHADRYFLGGAFLRYIWLPALIMGLCCLKLKRPGFAGFFLCFSAMIQIFPVLFLGAALFKIGLDFIKARALNPEQSRFILSVGITFLILTLFSITVGKGVDNWIQFKQKMDVHSIRMATGRSGYLYNFIFPKERDQGLAPYEGKYEIFANQRIFGPLTTRHVYQISIFLFILSFIGLVRKTDLIEFTLLTGFGMFFLLFSTVNYYYAGWLGIPLLLYRFHDNIAGKLYIALLFISMIYVCYYVPLTQYHYPYNTLLSMIYTLLLFAAIAFFNLLPAKPAETLLQKTA